MTQQWNPSSIHKRSLVKDVTGKDDRADPDRGPLYLQTSQLSLLRQKYLGQRGLHVTLVVQPDVRGTTELEGVHDDLRRADVARP
jgi:hypothetical protein